VLLYTFCILFAVNSAIHSYLIVRYSEGDKIAMQVGVYYASNAVGRLVGTMLSGVLYTYAGPTIVDRFGVCLFASLAFAAISAAVDVFLDEDTPGSSWWSPFNRCTCTPATTEQGETAVKTKSTEEGENTIISTISTDPLDLAPTEEEVRTKQNVANPTF